MKNARVWCLLGLLSLAGIAVSQAQDTSGATAKAVAALEHQWLNSQKVNNPDLAAPLLADKFVSTGSDGSISTKAQMLADEKSRKYSSADDEHVQITVFGDTVIATGVFTGKGTESSGKPFSEKVRWTDTWAKMPDGKWQCVATQSTSTNK